MNDYNCRRVRSGNIRGNIIFYICSSEKPAGFPELFFHERGIYKSHTPKHKSKDRQIAQGDYEQERAK